MDNLLGKRNFIGQVKNNTNMQDSCDENSTKLSNNIESCVLILASYAGISFYLSY